MTATLTAAGLPWRIAYTSISLTGQTAMVGAGLAITALTEGIVTPGLQVIGPSAIPDLPALPDIEIALHRRPGRPTDAARILGDIIRERFQGPALHCIINGRDGSRGRATTREAPQGRLSLAIRPPSTV